MLALAASANADWYLMRASGVVSLVLLTGVFVLGIATVRRWRPGQHPRFVTTSLHRSLSLLAVVFLAIHVLTALNDSYAGVSWSAVFVPFAATRSAFWVGLGEVSLDLIAALVISSLLRVQLGARAWRSVHWLGYAAWPLAFAHSIGTGSDAGAAWLRAVGGSCLAAIAAAFLWRLAAENGTKHLQPNAGAR